MYDLGDHIDSLMDISKTSDDDFYCILTLVEFTELNLRITQNLLLKMTPTNTPENGA